MAGNAAYTDPSTHPRVGTGVQYHDPDFDSPWWCNNIVIPNEARCETCKYWLGVCLGAEGRVTRAEDRCSAWKAHPQYLAQVETARTRWTPADAVTDAMRWKAESRRRKRLVRRAAK